MDALLAFLTASVVSLWGSLQLGLVNVAVIETTLKRDVKHAVFLALGGVLPEIPYTLIAIYGLDSLGDIKAYEHEIGYVIGAILIVIGVVYLIRKQTEPDVEQIERTYRKRGSFAKGVALASLNPQLIFFWSGFILLFENTTAFQFGDPPTLLFDLSAPGWFSPKWAFALGASFGAFVILCIYIYLSHKFKHRMTNKVQHRLNKVIGIFFIALGLYALARNII